MNRIDTVYQLGNLVFALSGEDQVLPHLREELKSIEIKDNKRPALIFRFGKVLRNLDNGVYASPVICTENEVLCAISGYFYRVSRENDALIVDIQSNAIGVKRRMFPTIAKIRDWNFLLPQEQLAKNFMYDVFDYLTQIQNLGLRQSYVHASSFTRGDRAVAVVAWGGIGKTTSMLKLVTEDNWKFLSDDLGLVDEDGVIYRSPKKMQIYAYNVEGQPKLKNMLLRDRPMVDMLNWYYRKARFGIKKVRRRVSAEELFKEKVGVSDGLTDVLFIERAAVKDFETHAITVGELASKAASTVMREIDPYHTIMSAIYSVQTKCIIPPYEEVHGKTKQVLAKAFSSTSPLLIKIPLSASPDELADFLRGLLR
ncbi:MAG: hypothetical protein JNK79_01560 [Chitinophagaceae bacterium]|nr:hypothetical protein [Chitinophagaceae bacterium]